MKKRKNPGPLGVKTDQFDTAFFVLFQKYDELFKTIYLSKKIDSCKNILEYYLLFLYGISSQIDISGEILIFVQGDDVEEDIKYLIRRKFYKTPYPLKTLILGIRGFISRNIYLKPQKIEDLYNLLKMNYIEFFEDVKKCIK